jgi:hypothetical protein
MSFKLDKAYLKKFRCLYRWCPPLPIPNREVKPTRADGTAVTRGRVGRCQILKETLQQKCSRVFLVKYRALYKSRSGFMANKIEIEQWFKAKGLRKEGQTFHLHALYLLPQ